MVNNTAPENHTDEADAPRTPRAIRSVNLSSLKNHAYASFVEDRFE